MAEDFFELDDVNWDELENPHPPTEGWHRAEVSETDTDDSENIILKFKITAGPSKGKTVRDTLWNPANSEEESKQKTSRNRRMLFAKRLGLITPEMVAAKKGARVVWEESVGTECWIKVKHKKSAKKDKQTGKETGEFTTFANLDFDGVFGIDDERVPEEAKSGGGAGGAPVGASKNGNGNGKPSASSAAGKSPVGAGASKGGGGGGAKANLDDLL